MVSIKYCYIVSVASVILMISTFSWNPQKSFSRKFARDVTITGTAIKKRDRTKTFEQQAESRKNAAVIQDSLCWDAKEEWGKLCSGGFPMAAAQQLLDGEDVNIVQIGAHVGFEKNDPLALGVLRLLDEVAAVVKNEDDKSKTRQRFHWTFVEPSPPNFNRLAENLSNYSAVCDMKGINAGVIPDTSTTINMPFYSLRDTIDPETGYDSLSGKTLPSWITQVSSFRMEPLRFNAGVFRRKGLVFEDYVVVTNVTTLPFSKLMEQVLNGVEGNSKKATIEAPLLVLLDTEMLDCDIIKGISPSSTFIPKYLVFEHKQCDYKGASEYLENNFGFDLSPPINDNIIGVKLNFTNSSTMA
uniref:Uncharacterized protein n=1 Tax=Ditylum brightwellii TaxID=49249 RepID=A0A7S4UXG1_9STRA|mmetsp:Transcript_56431/g.83887  ORF Transcript_56431/g.83887 Transcript_56431/m.83887 type:complete len:356 (-) Transcript_56431:79-1146(-)